MRTTPLERTLIENLTIYKKLIFQIKKTQASLSITSMLKDIICWFILEFEELKKEEKWFNYFLNWLPNTLQVFSIDSNMNIVLKNIDLKKNQRFYFFEYNIHTIPFPLKWNRKYKNIKNYLGKHYKNFGILILRVV